MKNYASPDEYVGRKTRIALRKLTSALYGGVWSDSRFGCFTYRMKKHNSFHKRKLGNSETNLSRNISIPRLLTGYSKPSSDYAMMTTAPGRSIHVDLETSELKSTSRQLHSPDPLSPTEELTPTYKVIRQQKCWVGGYITSQGRQ